MRLGVCGSRHLQIPIPYVAHARVPMFSSSRGASSPFVGVVFHLASSTYLFMSEKTTYGYNIVNLVFLARQYCNILSREDTHVR